jgi:hypothetical protein
LLVPTGCPGENVWVPPNEVKRWENIGYTRGNVPADKLELSWLDIPAPCISKEVRSYQRNQGVQPMNNETDLRRTISW